MAYMYVDIDLSEVDDDELIDELKARGFSVHESYDYDELLNKIYHLHRQGRSYEVELEEYITHTLGKVV